MNYQLPRHPWSVTPKEAIAIQQGLRELVKLSSLKSAPRWIAGVDLSYEIGGKELWAVIVVLDPADLSIKGWSGVQDEMRFPYVPGLLSFREIPALIKAWDQMPIKPDLIMADGHGIAHPRRVGIATHLGLITDTPTIGCGKNILVGQHADLGLEKGSSQPLIHQGETVGYALRTRNKVKPMYISPGHLIDLGEARKYAMAAVGKYRMPETTRQAHLLVNQLRRGEIKPGVQGLDSN